MNDQIASVTVNDHKNNKVIVSCVDIRGNLAFLTLNSKSDEIQNDNADISLHAPPFKKRKLQQIEQQLLIDVFHSSMKYESAFNLNANLCFSGYCAIDCDINHQRIACVSNEYQFLQFSDMNRLNMNSIQSRYLSQKPNGVKWCSIANNDSNCALVTEGNILSVWDERQPNCSQRVFLYSTMIGMDIDLNSGMIASCGLNKTVYFVDSRKWKIISSRCSFAKYALTSCHYSPKHPHIYCSGMDSDLVCVPLPDITDNSHSKLRNNAWKKCWRADAKWIGNDLILDDNNEEVLIGVSENATVYHIKRPHFLSN